MNSVQTILAVALVLAAAGCGAGAYDVHAFTALSLRDGSNALGSTLREHHRDVLREGADLERASGETDEAFDVRRIAALTAADVEWRRAHADWLDGQRAAARASTAYSNASYRGLLGEGDDLSALVAIGLEALRAVTALADIMRRNGFEDLPELPDGVTAFLGGE